MSVKNPLFDKAAATPRMNRTRSQSSLATPRGVIVDEEIEDSLRQNEGLHWASASALAPISYGDNAILHDIERKEQEDEENFLLGNRARAGTRARSGTVAQDLQVRNRKASMESVLPDHAHLFDEGKSRFRVLLNFVESLVPRLQQRINIYVTWFFIISLLSMARYYDDPKAWFAVFFTVVSIDFLTAIVDQLVFVYFIDKVFVGHYEIAYLLHGFNGPLGMLIAVLIIGSSLRNFKATQAVPNWDRLVSGMAVIVLCICVKNWYSRRHYMRLLERRFSDKLFKLQTWTLLLSELATYQHKSKKKDKDKDNNSRKSHGSTTTAGRASNVSVENIIPGLESLQKAVIDVFADLVDATSKYSDEFEEDVDLIGLARNRTVSVSSTGGTGSGKHRGGEPAATATRAAEISKIWKSELRKKRTFWELAARMSTNMGALLLYTYNGRVTIRRKFQAKSFGKSLFVHLSKGGRRLVTHEVLQSILFSALDHLHDDDYTGSGKHSPNHADDEDEDGVEGDFRRQRAKEYSALNVLDKKDHTDNCQLLYEAAVDLFDPFRLGTVSEEQCMAALCLVYKEQRFAATSLNDYGELHQSLRGVVDAFFWILMAFFFQAFLQWDIIDYLLPFITLILSLSFALSSLVGNVFLAISFVFFMCPFEVGNKIFIGADPNTRYGGYVKSISLLYTTINTFTNEMLKVPNHLLFHEKIVNCADSGGCVYTIDFCFNINDVEGQLTSASTIDEFFDRIKQWALVENKLDWQACVVFGTGLASKDNAVNYTLWVTHRDNWQDNLKALNARTALVRFIKLLQAEMGLTFLRVVQPVELVKEPQVPVMMKRSLQQTPVSTQSAVDTDESVTSPPISLPQSQPRKTGETLATTIVPGKSTASPRKASPVVPQQSATQRPPQPKSGSSKARRELEQNDDECEVSSSDDEAPTFG